MRLIEKMLESDFRMILLEDKVNVINYKKIEEITDQKITIIANKIIEIKGDNLVLNKMLNTELLISGNIKKIDII